VKRGDQISVVAVEFAEDAHVADGIDSGALMAQLIQLAFGLIKAGTVLGVAFIVIWFGLRPLTRMLIEQKTAEEAAALAAAGVDGALASGTVADATAAILSGGKPTNLEPPNLIEDLTNEVRNVSQKRLEQMVELDEEQAAAILKQWMRERAA
jgi:flagellar M-ring protein FliF